MSGAGYPLPRRPARRRRSARVLAFGALLALAGASAAWLVGAWGERRAAHAALPAVEGTLRVRGLEAALVVLRDRRGVPHVLAEGEDDAYWGLGFVHAQDRLSQMLWLRHAARGRRAELRGPSALPGDRLARTLGLELLAEAQVHRLDPAARSSLEAYAAGVNARLERLRTGEAALPPSLRGHAAALEPWRAADTLAIAKLLAWGLSGTLDVSLVLSDLIEHLGGFGARPFFPGGGGFDSNPSPTEPWLTAGASHCCGLAPDPLRGAAALAGRSVGSSAWVVAGAHSRSGLPLLAADSHLETRAPALFHQAHLTGGPLEVAGATVPGVPVFWTGHNRAVAWASVRARVVVSDLYVETLSGEDATRYHDGRRWKSLRERDETLRVRGGADEERVVRETRHGPIVTDLLEPRERAPLALAWAGAQPGDGVSAMLEVARAGSARALRGALAGHHEPPLWFVFADREGQGGLQLAGWIPRRQPAGFVAVSGRDRGSEWKGRIPFEELPAAELGGEGWLIAADATFEGEAREIEWLWSTGERAERIDALLRGATSDRRLLRLQDLAAMQNDVHSTHGPVLVAAALALAGDPARLGRQEREVAARLRSWDGEVTSDSVGASAYHVFVDLLTRALWSRLLGPDLLERYLELPLANPVALLAKRLEAAGRPQAPAEEAGADGLAAAVRRSLRETWIRLSVRIGASPDRWAWGRLHTLLFRPLWEEEGPGHWSLGPFPYAGDGLTLAAGEFDRTHPFGVRVASVFRMAADVAELGHVLTALAPGQSEHAASPHATDGVQHWLAGRHDLLLSSRLLIEEAAVSRLLLEPED